jgi:hypothetical protein
MRATLVVLSALVACGAGCAGLVGISDVPGGSDGGGGIPLPGTDGGVILPDGRITYPDTSVPPGHDGSVIGFPDVGTSHDGTTPPADGGTPLNAFTYQPSNIGTMTFDPSITGPLTLNADSCTIYTDDEGIGCASGQNPPMDMFTVTLPDGAGQALVLVFTYISISSDSSLAVRGDGPVILIAFGALDLAGSIDVSADNYDSDSDINVIAGARETGPGIGGFGNSGGPQGGGGGSFCGLGGTGAGTGGFAPGMAYGNATLTPIWGGSAGGGASTGGADGFANGNGGGALQISASGSITIHAGASINANGSGGISQGNEQGEGAGSGGAILLEGMTVDVEGLLEANGGEGSDNNDDGASSVGGGAAETAGCVGGKGSAGAVSVGSNGGTQSGGYGGGGGGAGWIRINGGTVMLNGVLSPSVATGCASQGPLP